MGLLIVIRLLHLAVLSTLLHLKHKSCMGSLFCFYFDKSNHYFFLIIKQKEPFNRYILFSSSRKFRLQIGCSAFPDRRQVRYLLISMITNAKEAERILSVGVRNSLTKFSRHRMQNKSRTDKICRRFISPSDAPATFK